MQFLAKMLEGQPGQACRILSTWSSVHLMIDSNPDLSAFLSAHHLAQFIVVAALADMPRNEIKQELLQASSILSLLECYPETADIFDSFLNGRFTQLNESLSQIRDNLKFSYFCNDQKLYSTIRANNLRQYVAPYRVLEIKDIAAAFKIDTAQAELELANQISSGKIKAKIDSYNKILYASEANKALETYQKVD